MEQAERTPEERIADKIFGPEDLDSESQETAPEAPEDDFEEDEGLDAAQEEDASEDDTEALEASDDSEEELVEIELDGEILAVPEKYKDYFLRQQDYTRKTQEVASQRKELEVIRSQVEQRAAEYEFAQSVWDDVIKAQQKQAEAQQYQDYLRQNVDNLSSGEIEKLRLAIQDAREEAQGIASEVQQKQQEFQQSRQQSKQELLKKGTEILSQKIPGWGEQHARQVRDFALSSGFTEAEVETVIDPRQVEVLWKAAQYDKLKANSGQAVKKVQSAPKIKEKSRNPMPDDVKRKLNLRKKLKSNRNAKQKADLIREDIADRLGL